MSLINVKRALERHLNNLTPALSTAYEGESFSPVAGTPYQRVQLVPRGVENPVLGDEYHRLIGEFQVFLAYPLNKGTGAALQRAELVKNHFKRGTFFQEGDVRVHVLETPDIKGTVITQDRLVVPIIIDYTAEVNS